MLPMNARQKEYGAVSGAMIGIILLGFGMLLLAGLSIWLFLQYSEQKNNVESIAAKQVADAVKKKGDEDRKYFFDKEKEPNREFVGPDDYGRLTFNFPKTWSTYVDKDGKKGGNFEAFLSPGFVPPVDVANQRFALRVVIESADFDQVLKKYESPLKKGDLTQSATSSNGQNGVRFDGNFTKDLRGAVVIYKVRDKTVSIFTDADTFKPDYENIIKTIKFNL